jgi:hypothetical protein
MFKTFPEFSKLTLDDRDEYETYVKEFPPIADLSFGTLMSWWNQLDNLQVSVLNGNLVIPYWLPGDDVNSGLSLVGTNRIDESLCTLFDHLREKGEPPRLVNVPELVIGYIQYPELFTISEERGASDYVLDINDYHPLENVRGYRRFKIQMQLRQLEHAEVEVRPLDLKSWANRQILLEAADTWWEKNINSPGNVEKESLKFCIREAHKLKVENVCLFVEGRLQGFCMYQRPANPSPYVIVNHVKATHERRLKFELIAHLFSKYFYELGATHININSDMGLLRLRVFMLTLGPVNFFRKYRVESA